MRAVLMGLVAMAIAWPAAAWADEAAATQPSGDRFALTVYSTADPATFDPKELAQQKLQDPYNANRYQLPGYGVVRVLRGMELQAGENDVRFTDVAAGIDPTTVSFQSLTAPDSTAVLEQNYEYDVVSGAKLLDKYLDKEVTISKRGAGSAPNATLQGTLLSADPGSLVLKVGNDVSVLSREDITQINLAANASALVTKPTLIWKLTTDRAGHHDTRVTYQTDGLTWRADYNITVNKDDSAADVGAWVTLLNESGIAYPDATLKLVAGDVQRVQPPQRVYALGGAVREMAMAQKAETFQEKSFFEYHLYTLNRSTTLPNNSTKQIELFPAKSNVPVTKTYVYYGLPQEMRYFIAPEPNQDRNLGSQANKKVDVYLLIQNDEKNGMGIPLPAGRIRVYKRDETDAAQEFVGEDVIQHTPKGEQVMVKLGSAFDVVGDRKQTDFTANYDGHVITESFEITLRNHKAEPVNVIVKENLFRWTNWEITQSSDKYEKQDARTIHFPVAVPANGSKTVTYTVKYTW